MEPINPSLRHSLPEVDHRLVHEYKDGGHWRERQNLKLKRLHIDETNQTYRRSINFSDTQPVKVTAKFQYIGAQSGSTTTMNLRGKDDENTHFPKIEEMAHFHYDNVDFSSPLQMSIFENDQPGKMTPEDGDSVKVKVTCRNKSWVITRNLGDFAGLDIQFHKCVYDRQFSCLESLKHLESERRLSPNLKLRLESYIKRLSNIAGSTIWCGPILNWFEVDNKGNHLMLTEDSAINVPAVAAAHVVKRYTAQASDELSFEVKIPKHEPSCVDYNDFDRVYQMSDQVNS